MVAGQPKTAATLYDPVRAPQPKGMRVVTVERLADR
jgi:hypothetical protein